MPHPFHCADNGRKWRFAVPVPLPSGCGDRNSHACALSGSAVYIDCQEIKCRQSQSVC